MIKRFNNYTNDLVFIDGMWKSGKSLLMPLIGRGENISISQMNHHFEYICQLNYLNLTSQEAASTLLQVYADLGTYNSYISREVNFRFHDDSGVWKNPKKLTYLKNLFRKDYGDISQEILNVDPKYNVMSHNIFPVSIPLIKAFGKRLKLIRIDRNPVYMMKSWSEFLVRLGKDPKIVQVCVGKSGDCPWWTLEEEEYLLLNPLEKALYSYIALKKLHRSIESQKLFSNNTLLSISFEGFVLDPTFWVKQICSFLGLENESELINYLPKINCPRNYLLEGISKQKVKWSRDDLMNLERSYYKEKLSEIKSGVNIRLFEIFQQEIKNYSFQYEFKRLMPWEEG